MPRENCAPSTEASGSARRHITEVAPGVELSEMQGLNTFTGRAEALIAAGVVRADQIPGQPGMPKTSAIFYAGELIPKKGCARKPVDQHWMRVRLNGRIVVVLKGLPEAEAAKRSARRDKELGIVRGPTPEQPSLPSASQALEGFAKESARYSVGDAVKIDGDYAMVTYGYGLHCAEPTQGQPRYRFGYVCKYRSGEEYFIAAWQITDEDGGATHLRLVRGARKPFQPALRGPFGRSMNS